MVGRVPYVVGQALVGADVGRGVGRRRSVDVGEDDVIPAGDQPFRDPATDPARSARHDDAAAHGRGVWHDTLFEQVFEIPGGS